jgi:hypothetical protein
LLVRSSFPLCKGFLAGYTDYVGRTHGHRVPWSQSVNPITAVPEAFLERVRRVGVPAGRVIRHPAHRPGATPDAQGTAESAARTRSSNGNRPETLR